MVKKHIFELPNPEAKRLPIVDQCLGGREYVTVEKGKKVTKVIPDCSRIFELTNGTKVCCAYGNPAAIHRQGCALGDNKEDIRQETGTTLKRKFKRKNW